MRNTIILDLFTLKRTVGYIKTQITNIVRTMFLKKRENNPIEY